MAKIKNIKKSESYGKLVDATGKLMEPNRNDIVVVAFGANGVSRLASAALNGEQPYVCSYHLRDLYDLKKADGTFDFDSAFSAFEAEFPIGYDDPEVHLYDFPVSDLIGKKSVKLQNGREMQTRRIASYASKDAAFVVAKNDMEKGLGTKYIVELLSKLRKRAVLTTRKSKVLVERTNCGGRHEWNTPQPAPFLMNCHNPLRIVRLIYSEIF